MKTVLQAEEAFVNIQGSRFLARLHPLNQKEEMETILASIRKQHPKATHVVSAYRWEDQSGYDDDGEPAQTSGAPMLSLLEGEQIVFALITCVRYFGGTKLGKGGLIRAYSEAAREAIRLAHFQPLRYVQRFVLTYAYEDHPILEHVLNQERVPIGQSLFTEQVQTAIYLTENQSFRERFTDITQGKGRMEEEEWVYISEENDKIIEREVHGQTD